MLRLSEGIHQDVPMLDYIADPCEEPALSTGVVKNLINRTPMHAHAGHPRLTPQENDSNNRSDIGSAAHALFSGEDNIAFIDADSYRTAAAKSAREEVYASGRIPMLEKQREILVSMNEVARNALDEKFGEGDFEQTVIAHDKVWRKSRPDWVSKDGGVVVDYKTCTNASPEDWIRTSMGGSAYDIQGALALMSLDIIEEERERDWVWLLQEMTFPFACSFVGMGSDQEALARRKVRAAARMWEKCLATETFPGYSKEVYWTDTRPWDEKEFEARLMWREASFS